MAIYYGNQKNSNIYNGVLALDSQSVWTIYGLKDLPINEEYIFYMQSGPLLWYGGVAQNINVQKTNARRIVFAQGSDDVYIIVLTGKNNFSDGPDLTETINILDLLQSKSDIKFLNALNLDGGNSSLFIDSNHFLKESVFAGSFLCFTGYK